MLDVHPPEHAPHTWRDFFIHIATIVVGLLIAIGLEQSVEWVHHRHVVHAARESIGAEIQGNRKLAVENQQHVLDTQAAMAHNLEQVQAYEQYPTTMKHGSMSFRFSWSSFEDSAWRTARDTGALALMPADEVQRYADRYSQQAIVNAQAIRLFEDEPVAAAPLFATRDVEKMTPADAHQLALNIASIRLRLKTLEDLLAGTEH